MSDIPRHITTSLPKALTAIRAVLELHYEIRGECAYCYAGGSNEDWPCETVEAIEGAING